MNVSEQAQQLVDDEQGFGVRGECGRAERHTVQQGVLRYSVL